jgi:hypothetical protein
MSRLRRLPLGVRLFSLRIYSHANTHTHTHTHTHTVERRPIQFTIVEFEYVVVFFMMMAVTVVLTGFTVSPAGILKNLKNQCP